MVRARFSPVSRIVIGSSGSSDGVAKYQTNFLSLTVADLFAPFVDASAQVLRWAVEVCSAAGLARTGGCGWV